MKAPALLALLLLPSIVFALEPAKADEAKDPKQLLREGLFEEEANRDFKKALEDYAAVVAQFDAQRSFAATALFRMAEIRAKQGDKAAAISAYQRLVRDFSEEETLVKLSRERLAVLGELPGRAGAADVASDLESKEIDHLRGVIKESPDLVNGDERSSPLQTAAENGWMRLAAFVVEHGAKIKPVALVVAAKAGHKGLLEFLVAHGGDLNASDKVSGKPLHAACQFKRIEIVRYLLGAGADVNGMSGVPADAYGTPLLRAVWASEPEIASLLLEHGADPNLTDRENGDLPLCGAVGANDASFAQLLLKHHANPNLRNADGETPLLKAIRDGKSNLVDLLLANGADANGIANSETPLAAAISNSNPKLVNVLLEHHADPNFPSDSPHSALLQALEKGDVESIHALLVAGADPNALDSRKLPLLLTAILSASESVIKELLDYGARTDAPLADGQTQLHCAVHRSPAVVRLLLDYGAKAAAANSDGYTPLHYSVGMVDFPSGMKPELELSRQGEAAAHRAEIEIWGLLLAKGADINARTSINQTPLHQISTRTTPLPISSIDWLVAHGADVLAKDKNGDLPFSRIEGEQRLELERKYLIPKWANQNALKVLIRFGHFSRGLEAEPIEIPALAEFDGCPSLREVLGTMNDKRMQFPAKFVTHIYRAEHLDEFTQAAAVEVHASFPILEDRLNWPALHWGDVVVLESTDPNPSSFEVMNLLLGRVSEISTVTVQVGDQAQEVTLGSDSFDFVWSPTEKQLPSWRFSDLVAHAVDAAPTANLGAVKIQRQFEGKTKEWTVDLRADDQRVKPLSTRLENGDHILIPLRPLTQRDAQAQRRGGIYLVASGTIWGEQVFRWSQKDPAPYTLCEFLTEAYAAGSMLVPNPDFSHIFVHRLEGDPSVTKDFTVDLANAIRQYVEVKGSDVAAKTRSADLQLEWGDIVELRSVPGEDARTWRSFDLPTQSFFKAVLQRTVVVSVPDAQPASTELTPRRRTFQRADATAPVSRWVVVDAATPGFSISAEIAPRKPIDRVRKVTIHNGNGMRQFNLEQLKRFDPWIRIGDESVSVETF